MNIDLYEEFKKYYELNDLDNKKRVINKIKQDQKKDIKKNIEKKEESINNKKIVNYAVKGGFAMMFLPFIMNNKNNEK